MTRFTAAIRFCARWARCLIFGGEFVLPAPEPRVGRWEVIQSTSGEMLHMRWSLPTASGHYLMVRHYPNTDWGKGAIEAECRRFNEAGRVPYEFRGGGEVPVSA